MSGLSLNFTQCPVPVTPCKTKENNGEVLLSLSLPSRYTKKLSKNVLKGFKVEHEGGGGGRDRVHNVVVTFLKRNYIT